jgi:DNA mismatch repair protein MutL
MSGIIQLLPESTANQIAAGEVVQRPASVVKELLENSIDAHATHIKLIIKNGGSTLIQVDDDGKGMNAFDARMCWERHATSKIKKADDLYNLNTLGFRGEALASIASVSDVEMKTKESEDNVGTYISISAGKVKVQEPVATKNGTSIAVKNLFFNIPARKNFLKSISVETRHIFTEFERIALSYPEIAFELYNQDQLIYKLTAGTLAHRIHQLFDTDKEDLIEVEEKTDIVNVTGFIGTPNLAKKKRGMQFLFANGRFIKDPYLNHAINGGYGDLLEPGKFPFFCLFLDVIPSKIDVNIHPTKHEVKFEDNRMVYSLILSVIKKSIGAHTAIPTFEQLQNWSDASTDSTNQQKYPTPPDPKIDHFFNPFSPPKERQKTSFEQLDDLFNKIPESIVVKQAEQIVENKNYEEKTVGFVIQLHKKYIAFAMNDELQIIHQFRAHQQVIYEEYQRLQHHTMSSQQLLFPRTLQLTPKEYQIALEINDQLHQIGFDISDFGSNSIIINGIPPECKKEDVGTLVMKILTDYELSEQKTSLDAQEKVRRLAAKNLAIKSGTVLSEGEMKKLVSDFLNCENRSFSPNGKKISFSLNSEAIERFFQ